MNEQTSTESRTSHSTSPPLRSLIGTIAAAMRGSEGSVGPGGRLGSGELAQLRRLDVEAPDEPAFWRLMALVIAPSSPLNAEAEKRWAVVLSGMARMAPHHHDPGRPVGRALGEAGFAEGRLVRLLRTRGPGFADAVRRVCGFLATRAEPLDWGELATLVLTCEPNKSDQVRRKIARDYYSSIERKEKGE